MGLFDTVLLTVDYDRTLTGPDSTIPQRNLDAIRYFMENGGAFTVNTGRSYLSFIRFLDVIPVNAPLLLMNGSASYENGEFSDVQYLPMDAWPAVQQVLKAFSHLTKGSFPRSSLMKHKFKFNSPVQPIKPGSNLKSTISLMNQHITFSVIYLSC